MGDCERNREIAVDSWVGRHNRRTGAMNRGIDHRLALIFVIASVVLAAGSAQSAEPGVWPVEKAKAWSRSHPWLVGCNFAPSTAINQLEMWQADTFDLLTIDRELGWAEELGFNSFVSSYITCSGKKTKQDFSPD